MKYRKKPIVIEAEQFLPDGTDKEMFIEYAVQKDSRGAFVLIKTLEGTMRLSEGDYLVTGVKGEKYPCRRDIFEETYEIEE
jgi:hypothetical protein